MTVPNTTSAVSYSGTGNTATYAFTWGILAAADLVVYTYVAGASTPTKLALTTDYTVAGVGVPAGGTITLVAGNLATGVQLFIASDPSQIQGLLLFQGAAFNANDIMNTLDYLTRMVEANRRLINNCIQIPVNESLLGLTTVLPAASARAGLSILFDAAGNAGVGTPISAGYNKTVSTNGPTGTGNAGDEWVTVSSL